MAMVRQVVTDSDPPGEQRPTEGRMTFGAPEQPSAQDRHNPSFGAEYWILGFAAASPAFFAGLALLAVAGRLPRVPRLPDEIVFVVLLTILALGTAVAHRLRYPAWTQPGVLLLPTLGFLLPAALLRGQIVTGINGDPDFVVAIPLVMAWLLQALALAIIVILGLTIGQYAPSFASLPLVPAPLIFSWVIVLAPPLDEAQVYGALGSALALAAFTTFVAWLIPARQRTLAALIAIGLQFFQFWYAHVRLPALQGAVRPLVLLDVLLFLLLICLVGLAPLGAAWMRRTGWETIRRVIG